MSELTVFDPIIPDVNPRFAALANTLRFRGLEEGTIHNLDYAPDLDPPYAVLFRDDADPIKVAAASAIIGGWDWTPGGTTAAERQAAIDAAFVPMVTSSPTVDALRAAIRALTDLINIRLRAAGLDPILDAEIMPIIQAYIAAGEGFPDRPQVAA